MDIVLFYYRGSVYREFGVRHFTIPTGFSIGSRKSGFA
jgi:hypothetical protein